MNNGLYGSDTVSCCTERLFTALLFSRTPLPTQGLLCLKSPHPGGCSEMKFHLALLILFLKGIPLLCSLPRPHTAAVWPTCCCVCQVHSKRAQHSRAHTKAGTLAPSQTLAVRKPQLSYNVKWAYKMPGEIAPRVDKPSNKQALGN